MMTVLDKSYDQTLELLKLYRFPIHKQSKEGRRRGLQAVLCQGAEIALLLDFGLLWQKGVLYVNYSILVHWDRAAQVLREVAPTPPLGLPKKIRELRHELFSIASLYVTRDKSWFTRPSPASFDQSEIPVIPKFLAEILEVVAQRVIPTFRSYCDVVRFAEAATAATTSSKLEIQPLSVLVVLGLTGRTVDYARAREAFLRHSPMTSAQLESLRALDDKMATRILH